MKQEQVHAHSHGGEGHTHSHDHVHVHDAKDAHSHAHTHEHTHIHDHEGIGSHEHPHAHEHVHPHPHPHDHSHPHTHDAPAQRAAPSEMDKVLALMNYMLEHNRQHTDELANMADKLEGLGRSGAALLLKESVRLFSQGNDKLAQSLEKTKED